MNLSPLIRIGKSLLACSVATALPLLSFGQVGLVAGGGEYPIVGLLPGVQAHPHASINASGGFLVWEDNTVDGNGLGIRAAALDSNLAAAGDPFRVNVNAAGDQEHPQVTLLNGGGAAFVWQGGRQSFQHIYARFLSSSNTWLTTDVLAGNNTANLKVSVDQTSLTAGTWTGTITVTGTDGSGNPIYDANGNTLTLTSKVTFLVTSSSVRPLPVHKRPAKPGSSN